MKPRLQSFDHRSSAYERPTQAWVCGRAVAGRPCALGPDGKGKCRTLTECSPRRSGDGWVCTRPENAGGACERGPLPDGRCCHELPPCVPVRSLRSRRGRLTAWATVVSFAIILILFGSRINADLVNPGPLITGHAEIEACGDCHVAFKTGPVGWLKAAFAPADPAADSDKCLACHKWGDQALNPHNLSKPQLSELTAKFQNASRRPTDPWTVQVSRAVFPIPAEVDDGKLACGTCHKEHGGEEFDLLEVSNARCQSCHAITFPAFSDRHPSFGDYPYLKRTRIIFDHDSHNRKNFPEKAKQGTKPPETCDSCHQPDGTGRFMLTNDFDNTCATCHSEDIIGETVAGPKGTAVIAVPELDIETLDQRAISIGEWPELAFAIDVSPYTKLLLAADAAVADDLSVIENTDLQDLSEASDAELAAVGRVAWAIKELLFDLTISGMEILETKVEASLDSALDTDTVGRLVGHIPQDVVVAAGKAWFPNLKQEVVAYREARASAASSQASQGQASDDDLNEAPGDAPAGDSPVKAEIAETSPIEVEEIDEGLAAENEALGLPTLDPEEWAKAGGWYRKDFILYYRPVGHEDVFFRTWLDISARSIGTPAERYGNALFALLGDKNTPGKCIKCHSVDQQQGGGLKINWAPFQPVPGESTFTVFGHETHFSAVGGKGCVACHQLNEDTTYQESFKGRDPYQFVANFAPIERETCARCHVKQSAGDSCVMCHQYHIGEFVTEGIPPTRIDDLDKNKQQRSASSADPPERTTAPGPDSPELAPAGAATALPVLDFDPRTGTVSQGGSQTLPGLLNDLLDRVEGEEAAGSGGAVEGE